MSPPLAGSGPHRLKFSAAVQTSGTAAPALPLFSQRAELAPVSERFFASLRRLCYLEEMI